jgi:hypothetical protein
MQKREKTGSYLIRYIEAGPAPEDRAVKKVNVGGF